jgi:hypothetical protein
MQLINTFFFNFAQRFFDYLPNFFGGLLIFLIGLVLSSILKKVLLALFSFFKISNLLQRLKLMSKSEVKLWEEVLAEILRWCIIISFLIPTLEAWGLSRATVVLNQFLFYLPNVIVAVVIGFVGLIAANLITDVVKNTAQAISPAYAGTISFAAKWMTIFFTVLVVLNQLGIAQDLIRILFTGIVAMIALAGGLAFGLGGKGVAEEILRDLKKKLTNSK